MTASPPQYQLIFLRIKVFSFLLKLHAQEYSAQIGRAALIAHSTTSAAALQRLLPGDSAPAGNHKRHRVLAGVAQADLPRL